MFYGKPLLCVISCLEFVSKEGFQAIHVSVPEPILQVVFEELVNLVVVFLLYPLILEFLSVVAEKLFGGELCSLLNVISPQPTVVVAARVLPCAFHFLPWERFAFVFVFQHFPDDALSFPQTLYITLTKYLALFQNSFSYIEWYLDGVCNQCVCNRPSNTHILILCLPVCGAYALSVFVKRYPTYVELPTLGCNAFV